MAMALAAPVVEAAVANAPAILAGAGTAYEMAKRYGPSIRGSVNRLMNIGRKKRSAKQALKKLSTQQGLHKFVKGVGSVGNEMQNISLSTEKALNAGGGRYHELLGKYAAGANELASPLKAYRF
jgi:hypothetical protein